MSMRRSANEASKRLLYRKVLKNQLNCIGCTCLSLCMTCITSLWNIWRTIWFGHCMSTCTGHHGSIDMCVRNHSQASWLALNCFVNNSIQGTIVGYNEKANIKFGTKKQEIYKLPSPWHVWRFLWRMKRTTWLPCKWRRFAPVVFVECDRIFAT